MKNWALLSLLTVLFYSCERVNPDKKQADQRKMVINRLTDMNTCQTKQTDAAIIYWDTDGYNEPLEISFGDSLEQGELYDKISPPGNTAGGRNNRVSR